MRNCYFLVRKSYFKPILHQNAFFIANCNEIVVLEGMNARIKEDYTMRERCNIIQLTTKLVQFLIDHETVDNSFPSLTSVQLKSAEKYHDRVKRVYDHMIPKKGNVLSSKGEEYISMMKLDGIIAGALVFCRVLPNDIEDVENEEKFTNFVREAGKCFKKRSSGSYNSFNQFRYFTIKLRYRTKFNSISHRKKYDFAPKSYDFAPNLPHHIITILLQFLSDFAPNLLRFRTKFIKLKKIESKKCAYGVCTNK